MVKKKVYRLFGIFIYPITIVMCFMALSVAIDYKEWWILISGALVLLGCFYGVTYKIVLDDEGLLVSSLMFPMFNDHASWSDVKRVKSGTLFREVEFYSKKRDKVISIQISDMINGINGKLDKAIMEKIGQKVIKK